MAKLSKVQCFMWRLAGRTAMILAIPLFAVDTAFSWMSKAVTIACACASSPLVIFYDWCVDRHNAIRRAALTEGEQK